MEFGEDAKPCQCGLQKICKNCEASTKDYTTKKTYCCNPAWWYMVLFGPRPVSPTDTCSKHALKRVMTRER